MADQVLTEWVLSEDEGLRFDARVLIDHRKIIVAIPALEERARALTSIATPGAPFELQAIDRLLKKLGGDPHRQGMGYPARRPKRGRADLCFRMRGRVRGAGGIDRMKAAFLEFAEGEFDDQAETRRLMSVVGWS